MYSAINFENIAPSNNTYSNANSSEVEFVKKNEVIHYDSMHSNADVDANNYQGITYDSVNSNASCSNVDTNNYQGITYDSVNSNASCSNVDTNDYQGITYDSVNSNASCSNVDDGNNSEAFNYDLVNQILSPYGNFDDTTNNDVGSNVENLQTSNNMSSYNPSFRALRTNSTARTGNIAYHITSVKVNGNNGKGFLWYPKDFPYMF